MSIIQTIRDRWAPVIIVLIAVSLVAFILMDAFTGRGGGGGGLFGSSTSVGSINGKDVDIKEFDARVKMAQANQQQQGNSEEANAEIVNQVWKQLVDDELISSECTKLGITFTTKELSDVLFGKNSPPQFKQQFTDPKTGIFNVEQAKQAISELRRRKDNDQYKQNFNLFAQSVMDQYRNNKFNTLIGSSANAPKWMLEKQNAESAAFANISFVNVPYITVSDTIAAVKVTDDEIKDFLSKHKDEYKEDPNKNISYVSFDALPSKDDSANTLAAVQNLKTAFITDTNAQSFILKNQSDMNYFDGYVLKSKMQMAMADTIRSLPIGGVFGPYLDGGTYVMAKMVATRSVPDSIKCRHILIKTEEAGNPVLEDSIAKKRIDSIEKAIQGGADFNAMVLQYSDDGGSKDKKGEYEFSSIQNLSTEFRDVVFYGKTGDKKVVKVSNQSYGGYHYIEVLNQKNFENAYKVAYMAKTILASPETDAAANSLAIEFAGNSRNAKAFNENATKKNYNKIVALNVKETDVQIDGLGPARQIIKWVNGAEVGAVSEPMSMNNRYFVVTVTDKNEGGLPTASKARSRVEPLIRNQKKAKEIIRKIGAAKTLADVATATGQPVLKADSISFTVASVPNLGPEPKVVGAAFNKANLGKETPPIEGGAGVYVIKVEGTGNRPAETPNFDQQRKIYEMNMKGQIQYGGTITEALKKAATVKDRRSKMGY
jgi:peptidyl-prolyl cis-trans isomerase D